MEKGLRERPGLPQPDLTSLQQLLRPGLWAVVCAFPVLFYRFL